MDWKKLAWCGVLSGALVMGGCGDDDTGMVEMDAGGGTDAGPGDPAECGSDDECFFVVDEMSIPTEDPDNPGQVNGFDLDGRNSDAGDAEGCFIEDWTAPDGSEGIDNQLAALAPLLAMAVGDIDMTIADALAEGTILLLAEFTASGGPVTTNGSGSLSLYLGQTVDGGPPMLSGSTIAPDQTFNLDPAGNPLTTVPVTISNATAEASVDVIALAIPFEDTAIALNIRSARVRATISGDSLVDGLIGGGLNIDELATTVMEVAPDFDVEMIRDILEGVADLEPNADDVCQSVSVGIEFHAVAAVKGAAGT